MASRRSNRSDRAYAASVRLPTTWASAASRISAARPHSGTRCSRLDFMRTAGIVQTPAGKSISAHCAPRRLGPDVPDAPQRVEYVGATHVADWHVADVREHVPPQARHPLLGMPGMAPAGVLALPGLGGRGDESPARGGRGGVGPRSAEPGRGRLREIGPLRAAAEADGRMVRGGLPAHSVRWNAR